MTQVSPIDAVRPEPTRAELIAEIRASLAAGQASCTRALRAWRETEARLAAYGRSSEKITRDAALVGRGMLTILDAVSALNVGLQEYANAWNPSGTRSYQLETLRKDRAAREREQMITAGQLIFSAPEAR
jgi:hypothetical protein